MDYLSVVVMVFSVAIVLRLADIGFDDLFADLAKLIGLD